MIFAKLLKMKVMMIFFWGEKKRGLLLSNFIFNSTSAICLNSVLNLFISANPLKNGGFK